MVRVGEWEGHHGLLFRWALKPNSIYGPKYEMQYSAQRTGETATEQWNSAGVSVVASDAVAAGCQLIALACYEEEAHKRHLDSIGEAALERLRMAGEAMRECRVVVDTPAPSTGFVDTVHALHTNPVTDALMGFAKSQAVTCNGGGCGRSFHAGAPWEVDDDGLQPD